MHETVVIVWDLETVPDLGGFAAANDPASEWSALFNLLTQYATVVLLQHCQVFENGATLRGGLPVRMPMHSNELGARS